MTIAEAAGELDLSYRRMQELCRTGAVKARRATAKDVRKYGCARNAWIVDGVALRKLRRARGGR